MQSVIEERVVRLIVNGRAKLPSSLKRSLRRAERDLAEQNITVETLVTQFPGDAERFARLAHHKRHAAVVAVGGDGTLNQVVNGVMKQGRARRSGVLVGVIPAGTANDFAKSLGIRRRDAYKTLLSVSKDRARAIDVGKVQSRYFVNFATGGFGAEATRRAAHWLKAVYGADAYFVKGVHQLLTMSQMRARFQTADWQWEGRVLAFAVGNGRQTGGGCTLCPKAELDDGEFDLMIIPAHLDLIKLLTSWVKGPIATVGRLITLQNPLRHGVIAYILGYYKGLVIRKRVKSLDIDFDRVIQLNLDGEPTEPRETFRVTKAPARLKAIIP